MSEGALLLTSGTTGILAAGSRNTCAKIKHKKAVSFSFFFIYLFFWQLKKKKNKKKKKNNNNKYHNTKSVLGRNAGRTSFWKSSCAKRKDLYFKHACQYFLTGHFSLSRTDMLQVQIFQLVTDTFLPTHWAHWNQSSAKCCLSTFISSFESAWSGNDSTDLLTELKLLWRSPTWKI